MLVSVIVARVIHMYVIIISLPRAGELGVAEP